MKRLFIVLSVAVLCGHVPAIAAQKPLAQYWAESDITFNFAEPDLSDEKCYADELSFLGCAYAANAVLGLETEPVALVAKSLVEAGTGYGPVLADVGAAVVVTPPKFTSDDTLVLYKHLKEDREANNKAWKQLYADRVHSQVSFEEVWKWVRQSPAFKEKEAVMAGSAINGYLGVTNDPHTMMLPAAYLEEQSSAGGNNFTGVGVILKTLKQGGKDAHVIDEVVEGGPADKAGVQVGDVLVAVDGKSLDTVASDQITSLIRGPEGKAVELTVKRKGQEVKLSIVRARIVVPNVSSKVLAGDVGYIKYGSFMQQEGCTEIGKAVKDLTTQGAKSLVLDLRENGGGLILQAQCIANIFLKKDDLVVFKRSLDGSQVDELRTQKNAQTDLPLIVLVDAHSASASELLSGALQDNRRAFVVGQRSFGKGSVQTQGTLPGGKLVVLQTIAKFYLPSGRSNQILGITPDLVTYRVPNPTEADKFALREEDEFMAFQSTETPWQQPRPDEVGKLSACVQQQGTALNTFNEGASDTHKPDYQKLVAVDAAHCAVSLGLSGEEPHPDYHAPKPKPKPRWGKPLNDILNTIWQRLQRNLP